MKRLILGAAAALVLTAGQASAEGLYPGSRIAAEPMSPQWTGFYLGAGVGAGAMVTDVSAAYGEREYKCHRPGECELTDFFGLDGIGGEGFFGTVSVGFDRQLGRKWVAGVFADYDFGSSMSTDAFLGPLSGSLDQNYTWSVGGRVGYLVNPSTMLYGTAGYTETELELSGAIGGKSLGSASDTFDGYFVGAGLETMVRSNWSLKLEYRFSQFDDVDYGFANQEECFNLSVEPSQHTARLVLSYKFGGRDGGSIKD